MKQTQKIIPLVIIVALMPGCASLVSHSTWPVEINSIPNGAVFSIVDENGQGVRAGSTPMIVNLESGDGFFHRARYTVHFKKKDFWVERATLGAKINDWYWGNLIFGWFFGMLVFDPATGAMFELPETFTAVLKSKDPNKSSAADEFWNYQFKN
jgi:hypothetical protein